MMVDGGGGGDDDFELVLDDGRTFKQRRFVLKTPYSSS
mgnify:CR=1 FL=1